jgi:hypothetical protein
MTRSELITDIVNRLYNHELIIGKIYDDIEYENALYEAMEIGLIKKPVNIYLITEKGILFIKSGKTYNDFLDNSLSIQSPSIVRANLLPNPRTTLVSKNNFWKNEVMLYVVYPLLVLLIGSILLKCLGVI